MNFNLNIMDFFKLPTKIIFAITIATAIILFLPDSIVEKIYMEQFRDRYGFLIGVIFLVSLSILIVALIVALFNYARNKYFWRKFKKDAPERLRKLDDYQKYIVYKLFSEKNHTSELPLHDGAVQLLKQNFIIVEATSNYAVSDLNNAKFPYLLQPWVVEELQKDQSLLTSFYEAYNYMAKQFIRHSNHDFVRFDNY